MRGRAGMTCVCFSVNDGVEYPLGIEEDEIAEPSCAVAAAASTCLELFAEFSGPELR